MGVPVIVKREWFRLEDVLDDGEYPLSIKDDKIAAIFSEHELTCVNKEDNPEVIDFIRHFVWWNSLRGTKVRSLDDGEYEIDVSTDKNVQALHLVETIQAILAQQQNQLDDDSSLKGKNYDDWRYCSDICT